ncbi:guanine nucleotide-binding protein subunit gamma 3-like isoform X2 [Sesamum indicum]|uniref:Guanine nucleotide-binding protein subunit gamma 3-like isoform X2 n=2 Tax=Sesamum indicum TaxID=4182 RepID=A0A8M8VBS2_SESIN|nr:guanine nucleotide-binding protein subunit gamma 3-like isoform X2 [Sesamum indicum]
MTGLKGNGSPPSLPLPRPKSPPEYADLYRKRREMAKVQMLEREIGFLEEELKSIAGLQPASRPCKELAEFVTCNADPLIPVTKKIRRSCCLWKWLCGASCFNVSSICCCCCQSHLERTRSHDCTTCSCSNPCKGCPTPKCNHCFCCSSRCSNKPTCSWTCCIPKCPSCLTCPSTRCVCNVKCLEGNMCSCCTKSCCNSCLFCY